MNWFRRKPVSASAPSTVPSPLIQATPPPPAKEERRYREDVPYLLPKDLNEINRLEFQHFALRAALKGNHLTTLRNPRQILDIGSGTGVWGREICREFPRADVYNVDLEAELVTSPTNYHFVTHNILEGLPFPDNTFDFVHQRLLLWAIPAQAWSPLIKEMLRVSTPGGHLEIVEGNGITFTNTGPALSEILEGVMLLAKRRGIDPTIPARLEVYLHQQGTADVEKQELTLPIGRWGGRIGALMEKDLLALIASFRTPFMAALGYKPDKFDRLYQSVESEWNKLQTSFIFFIYTGKKPD
jgi:SAM-dependent methyltransferase